MLYPSCSSFFFFNDTATTEIYTLSLHDALPILPGHNVNSRNDLGEPRKWNHLQKICRSSCIIYPIKRLRSEEHTSELQSPDHLVCRLLLEKKKKHHTD